MQIPDEMLKEIRENNFFERADNIKNNKFFYFYLIDCLDSFLRSLLPVIEISASNNVLPVA